MRSTELAFGIVLAVGISGSFGAAGCSCNSNDTAAAGPGATSSASASTSTSTGTSGGPLTFTNVGAAPLTPAFDVALSPDGAIAYFSASGPDGVGVYSVPVPDSGTPATPLKVAAGDPLQTPFAITVGTDGKMIYIADMAAEGTKNDGGKIWAVLAEGGVPTEVSGGDNTHPRALDIVSEGGKDQLLIAGTVGGISGVFKLPVEGGEPTSVISGSPFIDPEAIAAASDGSLYVLDAIGGDNLASIYEVKGAQVTELIAHLHIGFPGGLAVNTANTKLYVSGLDPVTNTAVIWEIDKASKEPMPLTDKAFATATEPGGLHRAFKADVLGWAVAGKSGGVFIAR